MPQHIGSAINVGNARKRKTNKKRTNRHLSLGTIRGVISLYKAYFTPKLVNGKIKRLSKSEKKTKWRSYKNKMLKDFNRVVKGQFSSEKSFIKRYSDPLYYVKYKLKRSTDLDLDDLTQDELDYYKEIGGTDDINELIRGKHNIDSVDKASEQLFGQPPLKKRRLNAIRVPVSANNSLTSTFDFEDTLPIVLAQSFESNNNNSNSNHNSNSNNNSTQSVHAKVESTVPVKSIFMDEALDQLQSGLDIYEKELLEKKKAETFQITQQKIKSLFVSVKDAFINHPESIGCIMGAGSLEDQLTSAFDLWLHKNKIEITRKVADINLFIEQISVLKQDPRDWMTFVSRFKTERILKGNHFERTWIFMKTYLNIAESNDKEEIDEDDDFDIEIDGNTEEL